MRIHQLAMLALLAAALSTGCDSARDVKDARTHANAWGCDQCHGYPPTKASEMFPADAALQHPLGVTPTECYVCHPGTVQPDGHTIVTFEKADSEGRWTLHRDGQVESYNYKLSSCDLCHGLPPDTGRHVFHIARGLVCNDCHMGYDPTHAVDTGLATVDDATHMNGVNDVVLGVETVVDPNDRVVTAANLADKSWPDSECAQCHAKAGVSSP